MKTSTRSSVTKRENFLIETYQANKSVAYNHKKKVKQERADKLLDELRTRYGIEIVMKAVDMNNVTADMITQNGKYSLD